MTELLDITADFPDLSRNAASTIAQLRITHAPINSYLKRCKKISSSQCPACGAENESVSHFLLSCPSYAHERWTLHKLARKKKKPLTLQLLLGDPDMATHLASYIDATYRFKHNPGEYTTNRANTATR
jgi:hypothetical protein